MREALKSAARPGACGGEEKAACRTGELIVSSHFRRRIVSYLLPMFHVLVILGPLNPKLRPEIEEEVAKHQNPLIIGVFSPPYFPPKSSTQSAGPPPEARKPPFCIDQHFDPFLISIFDRFWVVLGGHFGVMLGTFGGQVGPSSLQNTS